MTFPPPVLGRFATFALILLFTLGYLSAVAPDIYFRDAGELSASAVSLGIAHPTGFPLYLLLAKLATFIPFGGLGFRVNLLSLACSVVTLVFLASLLLRLTGDRAASLAMTIVFGVTSTYWLHSTTAEVYVPNICALVGLVHLLLSGLDGSKRALRMAAVLTGLGAGLHAASFALIGGAMWLATLITIALRRGWRDSLQSLVWAIPLVAMGMMTLLYLPLRAAQTPYCNWGDPSSSGRLLDHLTGARIRAAFDSHIGGTHAIDIWLERVALQVTEQLSWTALLVGVGIVLWLLKRQRDAGILLIGACADIVFTVLLNPMGMDDRQTGLFTMIAAIAMGASGLAALRKHVLARGLRMGSGWLSGLIAVGLAIPALIAHEHTRDLRYLYHSAQLGHEALDQAMPGALMLVTSDDLASSVLFLQGTENRRPDVTMLVKQHLADPLSLKHARNRKHSQHVSDNLITRATAGDSPLKLLQQVIRENQTAPILYEPGDSYLDRLVAGDLRLDLPLARLYGEPTRNLMSRTYFYRMRWRALSGPSWPGMALSTLSRRFSGLGISLWERGNERFGLSLVREACALAPMEPVIRNNCGILEIHRDEHELALRQFDAALRARPTYALGWFNRGVALYHLGRAEDAARSFATAARLGVSATRLGRAFLYSSVLAANSGRRGEAYRMLGLSQEIMADRERTKAEGMLDQLAGLLLPSETDKPIQSK